MVIRRGVLADEVAGGRVVVVGDDDGGGVVAEPGDDQLADGEELDAAGVEFAEDLVGGDFLVHDQLSADVAAS
jgi:hypothetical protein